MLFVVFFFFILKKNCLYWLTINLNYRFRNAILFCFYSACATVGRVYSVFSKKESCMWMWWRHWQEAANNRGGSSLRCEINSNLQCFGLLEINKQPLIHTGMQTRIFNTHLLFQPPTPCNLLTPTTTITYSRTAAVAATDPFIKEMDAEIMLAF